jgi:hypothetical protein
MFSAPGHVFESTEGVGSLFHVLRLLTHFRRYRGRRVPFSFFERPDSFSAVPKASDPVFMFCAPRLDFDGAECVGSRFLFCVPGLIFGGTKGVGSRFHVLRARTHFRQCRWRQVLFSCFTRPNSFSVVPRASGLVFMFCPPRLVFNGSEGVGSHFQVLRARNNFRRYRGRRVLFSCFALPDSFSAVPRLSGPVFMFCAPRLVLGGPEGIGSRFHV